MLLKNRSIAAVAIFIASYILSLLLWIQIKPIYGRLIAVISSELTAATTDVEVKESHFGKENIKVTFTLPYITYKKGKILRESIEIEATMGISSFTFNIPLTFSLILALFPVIKWKKKNLLEALFILIAVHVFFIYSYFYLHILYSLAKLGIRPLTSTKQILWEFLWSFTDNMVIRFEPFLLSIYIWLRNASKFN